MVGVKWLEKPGAHDFPVAEEDYLGLLADMHSVRELMEQLQAGAVVHKQGQKHSSDSTATSATC